jgi:hypothetical protein
MPHRTIGRSGRFSQRHSLADGLLVKDEQEANLAFRTSFLRPGPM